MIPKIIHYCWFGRGGGNDLTKNCLRSWKKFLPDYEIKLWNEDTFDIQSVTYTAQAYKAKKWAFVADYVRIWALKNYGGIYLDSDVEVLKSFNDLLNQKAFTCFEHHASEDFPILEAAVIASEKDGRWINKIFEYFKGKSFIDEDGVLDVTPVPYPMALKTKELYEIKFNNKTQYFDNLTVYSHDYFSPKSNHTFEIELTTNTYAIHHFTGTWIPKCSKIIAPYIKKYGTFGKFLCCILHPIASIQQIHYKRTHREKTP